MVLYLVYQLRRMLKSHTYRYTFGFYVNICRCKVLVNITCRVSGGKYYRSSESLFLSTIKIYRLTSFNTVVMQKESCHLRSEMNLTATLKYLLSHIFYNTRQFIRTDVRMCI